MHKASSSKLVGSLLLRRGRSGIISNNKSMRMRLSSTLINSIACTPNLIMGAMAWGTAPRAVSSRYASKCTPSPLTRCASTVMPADEKLVSKDSTSDETKTSGEGKPIAEGAIVSYYRGGLAAIQVRDYAAKVEDDTKTSSGSQGDDLLGHQVVLPSGALGVVVAHRAPIVFVYPYMDDIDESGNLDGIAKVLDSVARISIVDDKHVVDCFGRAIDESAGTMDQVDAKMNRPIFAPIPQVKDISLINSPMLTGTTMVDVMAPIGKGQNMLVVGHDVPMMRGFARDFLSTQVRLGSVKCIYAITKDSQIVLEQLKAANLLDDVIVVSSRCGEDVDEATKAAEATIVAATACSIAESFALANGQDTLVIVDSIDQHKKLWAATTHALVDVFGVDAVVQADREGGASSEMRAFYSSLIQRAAKFNKRNGGGSVSLTLLTSIPSSKDQEDTVYSERDFEHSGDKIKARLKLLMEKKIPLTEAILRKIDIPIPSASEGERRLVLHHVDDLISMSDGQIWLDERLTSAGQSPPMDPQRSITRVGIGADTASRADAPALRRIVEGVRLEIAQAASMDGAEVTEASRRQLRKRNAWLLAMHQEPGQGGRSLSESCVVLLAASIGALDRTLDAGGLAGTKKGQEMIQRLLEHVRTIASDSMKEIDVSLDLSTTARSGIVEAIGEFSSSSSIQ